MRISRYPWDPDGMIEGWDWEFVGTDEINPYSATGSGETVTHTFPEPGIYSVTLTVTDDPEIVLTVTTSKVRGVNIANLSWTGGSAPYVVARNATTIASGVTTTSYTDNTGTRGNRTFTYQVCDVDDVCSDEVTVTFN